MKRFAQFQFNREVALPDGGISFSKITNPDRSIARLNDDPVSPWSFVQKVFQVEETSNRHRATDPALKRRAERNSGG